MTKKYDAEKARSKRAIIRRACIAIRRAEVALGCVPIGALVRDRVGSISDLYLYEYHKKGWMLRSVRGSFKRNPELSQEKLTEMYIHQEPVPKDVLYGTKFS